MAKKNKNSWPKWLKVLTWVVGVLVGIIIVIFISLKVWVSTWPVDQQPDFAIRYPQGWYAGYGFSNPTYPYYSYSITTPPTIEGEENAMNFSDSKLRIQINIMDNINIEDNLVFNLINDLRTSGIKLDNSTYLKFYYPDLINYVTVIREKTYLAYIDIEEDNIAGVVARFFYLIKGFLIISSLQ